jgi:putative transposase
MADSSIIQRTFKYRLKPTKAQQRQLDRTLDLCRVYNSTLAVRKNAYEHEGKSLSLYDTNKLLPVWKANFTALKGVHSQVLQDVQKRVDLAFRAFFRRVALSQVGAEPGYPRFKGKGQYKSITYPQYGNGVSLNERTLTLSKIGEVKVVMHRPIAGTIKTVIIQRSAGKWYVCFSCEVAPSAQPLPPSPEVVGVDPGLKAFATLSTGEQIKRQRWMKRDAKDIARLQRKKEQHPTGSPERRKVVKALQQAYQRQANRRNNFAHQESRKLVNRFGLIVFEKLDIADMQSNGSKVINRNMADVAWARFVAYSAYKAESAGRAVVQVNPRGTTQMCSGCGEIVPKDLSVRVHDCPHCGLKLDRDLNAAWNILALGLQSIGAAHGASVTRRSPQL